MAIVAYRIVGKNAPKDPVPIDKDREGEFLHETAARGYKAVPVVPYDLEFPTDPMTGKTPGKKRVFIQSDKTKEFEADSTARGVTASLQLPSQGFALHSSIQPKEITTLRALNDTSRYVPKHPVNQRYMQESAQSAVQQAPAQEPPSTPEGGEIRNRITFRQAMNANREARLARDEDVRRTLTAVTARGYGQLANMAAGVLDEASILTGNVPLGNALSKTEMFRNARQKLSSEAELASQIAGEADAETLKQGGVAAAAAQRIGSEAAILAPRLALIRGVTGRGMGESVGRGADWVKGAGGTLKQAAGMAGFVHATTPGTMAEKNKAAGLTFAYMATPAFSSLATSDAAAIIADIGLNTGISMASGAWDDAIAQARAMADERGEPDSWKKYLAVTLSPSVLSDVAFSLGTRAANGDTKARAAIQQIEQRAGKVAAPADVQGKAQAVQGAGEQKIATADVLSPIKAGTPEGNARLEQIAAEQARIDAENARAEEEAAGVEDAPPAPRQPISVPPNRLSAKQLENRLALIKAHDSQGPLTQEHRQKITRHGKEWTLVKMPVEQQYDPGAAINKSRTGTEEPIIVALDEKGQVTILDGRHRYSDANAANKTEILAYAPSQDVVKLGWPAPKQPPLAPTTPQSTVGSTEPKIVATGPAISKPAALEPEVIRPPRIERDVYEPRTSGNPHPTKWAGTLRVNGLLTTMRKFNTEAEARAWVETAPIPEVATRTPLAVGLAAFDAAAREGKFDDETAPAPAGEAVSQSKAVEKAPAETGAAISSKPPIQRGQYGNKGVYVSEVLGGREKGVISPLTGGTARNVDDLVAEGMTEITVRSGGKIADRESIANRLKELGFTPWEKDNSVWIRNAKTSTATSSKPPRNLLPTERAMWDTHGMLTKDAIDKGWIIASKSISRTGRESVDGYYPASSDGYRYDNAAAAVSKEKELRALSRAAVTPDDAVKASVWKGMSDTERRDARRNPKVFEVDGGVDSWEILGQYAEKQGYVRSGDRYVFKGEQAAPAPRGIDLAKLSPQDAARVAELQRAFIAQQPAKLEDDAMRAFDYAMRAVDPSRIDDLPKIAQSLMNKRAGRTAAREARTESVQASEEVGRPIEAVERRPDEQVAIEDAARVVEAARQALPEPQRNALQAELDGDLPGYAKRNGIPISTARKRAATAKAKLVTVAKQNGIDAGVLEKTQKGERGPMTGEGPGTPNISRVKNITQDVAQAGRERLKGLIDTAKRSPNTTEGVKEGLGKQEANYEQQRTRQMKDAVLSWFTADKADVTSRVDEAERFVRDSAEDMDVKGAVSVALLEHYRNTANDKAALALIDFVDPLMRGAGRLNQAASMLNALSGKGWADKVEQYIKDRGITLTDARRNEILSDFKNAAKIPDESARNQAIHRAIEKLATEVPLKTADWLDSYRYSNMLSNPQATARNIYGNLLNTFVTRPASLLLQGKVKGAWQYSMKAWQQLLTGQAFRDAVQYFKSSDFGKYADSLDRPNLTIFDVVKREQGPNSKAGKVAWKAVTAIPRSFGAQDAFFSSMIEVGETYRLVKAGETPEDASRSAKKLADRYLYRDKLGATDKSLDVVTRALDSLGKWIETGRNAPVVGKGISWFVPFLRTPVDIAKFNTQASPLAYLGLGMNKDGIANAQYGRPFAKLDAEQKAVVTDNLRERQSLAALGTMVTVLGSVMAINGQTTWSAPQDEKARKAFYDSGRRPYSFEVNGNWIPMYYLGPFMFAFALPAAARDAFADNPNAVDDSAIAKLSRTAMGIPKIVLAQTPVSGVGNFLEALQGKADRTISSTAGSIASQFVPLSGLMRWINKMVDPTYRKPVTALETIEAGIPGLSQTIQAYTDSEGLDVKRPVSDIWMPYTIGSSKPAAEGSPSYEDQYQSRIGELKENVKYKASEYSKPPSIENAGAKKWVETVAKKGGTLDDAQLPTTPKDIKIGTETIPLPQELLSARHGLRKKALNDAANQMYGYYGSAPERVTVKYLESQFRKATDRADNEFKRKYADALRNTKP